jgi:membrane dipeptidase
MMSSQFGRRQFLSTVAAGALTSTLLARRLRAAESPAPAARWNGYANAVAIDALCSPGNANKPDRRLDAADLADIRASGLTAINLTVGGTASYANDYAEAIARIARWDTEITAHSDTLLKFSRASDLIEAKRSKRLAVIYGFQDATPLGEDLERLDTFEGLGLRILQLTYNVRNLVGDGCMEPGNAGLSRFGSALVERMNARAMLVDLSHCGQRTTDEAITMSKNPVAVTHGGCASVHAHPRNKTDATLRKLAERGGVIGIYLMPYLRDSGQPRSADVIAHIEHALKVCGEDHVGIGSDGMTSAVQVTPAYQKVFADAIADRRKAGISAPGESAEAYTFVSDFNTPRRLETIGNQLAARGHADRVIEKVIGGNFLRLFNETWRDAPPVA